MPDDSLSQDEIDALMSAVTAGEDEPQERGSSNVQKSTAVAYDFKRPKLISKDQKRTIQMLYDTFAKYIASALSMYLRTNVHLDVTMIEQFTYGEYIMSLPETTCITQIKNKNLRCGEQQDKTSLLKIISVQNG